LGNIRDRLAMPMAVVSVVTLSFARIAVWLMTGNVGAVFAGVLVVFGGLRNRVVPAGFVTAGVCVRCRGVFGSVGRVVVARFVAAGAVFKGGRLSVGHCLMRVVPVPVRCVFLPVGGVCRLVFGGGVRRLCRAALGRRRTWFKTLRPLTRGQQQTQTTDEHLSRVHGIVPSR
jgi:hypothetical protein